MWRTDRGERDWKSHDSRTHRLGKREGERRPEGRQRFEPGDESGPRPPDPVHSGGLLREKADDRSTMDPFVGLRHVRRAPSDRRLDAGRTRCDEPILAAEQVRQSEVWIMGQDWK